MLKYLPIVLCCTAERKYSLCSKVFPIVLKILPLMLNKTLSLDIQELISRLVVSSAVNITIALYTQGLLGLSTALMPLHNGVWLTDYLSARELSNGFSRSTGAGAANVCTCCACASGVM